MTDFVFRKLEEDEVDIVCNMIQDRMTWMEEHGIHQWVKGDYDAYYDHAYFLNKQKNGELFGLVKDGRVISCAVLLEEDTRWPDSPKARYLHNFVSCTDVKDAGKLFIQYAEAYAKDEGKAFFRLDSGVDNKKLAEYYTSLGYVERGRCEANGYFGILREKKL